MLSTGEANGSVQLSIHEYNSFMKCNIPEANFFTFYCSLLFLFVSDLCFNAGSNGQVMYGGVSEEGFIINPVTGVITTTKELDTELQSHYTLTGTKIFIFLQNSYTMMLKLIYFHRASQVQYRIWSGFQHQLNDSHLLPVYARDGGLPPNFAKAVVRVEVQDVNDNAPVFARPLYELEVPENQAPVELCFLKAKDPDSGPGGELEYRITGKKEWCV